MIVALRALQPDAQEQPGGRFAANGWRSICPPVVGRRVFIGAAFRPKQSADEFGNGDVVGNAPATTDGLDDGWFYDDFSEDVTRDCPPTTPQRIAFSPNAKPPTGVTVKLECLNETQSLANSRTDILTGGAVYQPSVGDKCDNVVTASGATLSGNEACHVTLKDQSKDTSMFCHPQLNVCVLECSTDADCPPSWVCDNRQLTLEASGDKAICVNPTCGDL